MAHVMLKTTEIRKNHFNIHIVDISVA